MKNNSQWYISDTEKIIEKLKSNLKSGLNADEIKNRAERYGENKLIRIIKTPWYKVFARQFTDVLILILFVAAIISFAIGEIGDAITILVIILLNGVLGFVQEFKAENAIEALREMLHPTCKVLRDSKEKILDAKLLVPGDIVFLEIGDKIPADLRLIESFNLKVDESSLTGESASLSKQTSAISTDTPLSQISNMGWMGTAVVNGRATGIVVQTGMNTQFGKIAQMMQSVDTEPTPLQKKLAVLGKQLGIYSVAISILVALVG